VRAVNESKDRAARDNMALASTLAGIALSNCGVALIHALEYPMGGTLHCSHGEVVKKSWDRLPACHFPRISDRLEAYPTQ
jgi:alcohol dehydrogenase class IV